MPSPSLSNSDSTQTSPLIQSALEDENTFWDRPLTNVGTAGAGSGAALDMSPGNVAVFGGIGFACAPLTPTTPASAAVAVIALARARRLPNTIREPLSFQTQLSFDTTVCCGRALSAMARSRRSLHTWGVGWIQMRVLVLGSGDLAVEVCEALEAGGAAVTWVSDVDDEAVQNAVREGGFDVVCVPSREDAFPLRMALLVRHLDETVRLVVTIFDPVDGRAGARHDPGLRGHVGRRHRRSVLGRSVSRRGHRGRAPDRFPVGRPGRVALGGSAADDPRAPAALAGRGRVRPARPLRRAAVLRGDRARADAAVRVDRVDDRARPVGRGRAVRLEPSHSPRSGRTRRSTTGRRGSRWRSSPRWC